MNYKGPELFKQILKYLLEVVQKLAEDFWELVKFLFKSLIPTTIAALKISVLLGITSALGLGFYHVCKWIATVPGYIRQAM